jgi:hypothetical protein
LPERCRMPTAPANDQFYRSAHSPCSSSVGSAEHLPAGMEDHCSLTPVSRSLLAQSASVTQQRWHYVHAAQIVCVCTACTSAAAPHARCYADNPALPSRCCASRLRHCCARSLFLVPLLLPCSLKGLDPVLPQYCASAVPLLARTTSPCQHYLGPCD